MTIQEIMPKTDRHLRYTFRLFVALAFAASVLSLAGGASAQSDFGEFTGLAEHASDDGRVAQPGQVAQPGRVAQPSQVAQAGTFINDGQAYTVMHASQFPTAANRLGKSGTADSEPGVFADEGLVQQVGCQSCGNSYGGYSSYGSSFGSYGNACSNACGVPCDPYCYVNIEGLYMARDDQNRGLSRNITMADYDSEWAPRITLGSLPNCVNGFELTFVGPLEWTTAGAVTGGAGQFGTIFGPPVALPNPALTTRELQEALRRNELLAALPGAEGHDSQIQALRSEFWSIEANRTLVGWDVAKILFGGRYIEYDEDAFFTATRSVAPTSVASGSSTENRLIGAQLGLDLLYPVGTFAYTDLRARAGLYYNQADATFTDFAGTNISSDEGDLAYAFELGAGIRYQLGEILSVRAGSELWYIDGVAAANDQYRTLVFDPLDRVLRGQVNVNENFFVLGFNLGAELRY